MADNQNTPGAQGSGQLRSTGKELLDSLKEQLRLEGDFRDILRDSVRDLQKSIKLHDTISAKLEAYSNTTINIKQVQTDINKNLVNQGINKIKLIESQKKLGGLQSEQVKIADEYLKALDERSNLEDDYLSKRSESYALENKLKTSKKDEFESVSKYFTKLEEQKKLEAYIAELRDRKGNNAKKDLAFNEQKLTKLKDEITLQKESFNIDQQDYINSKNLYTQAEESVRKKEAEVATIQRGLNLEQAAYIQAKKTNELYESNNQKLKTQEDFEKRSQKNAGVLGLLVGGLAGKFGLAEKVQEDMVAQQKKLAAEALASGRKSGSFYDKFSVAKVGLKSIGRGIKENLSDPIMKYGAILGGAALAYKAVSAGFDMIGNAAAKAGNFLAGLSDSSSNLIRGLTSGLSGLARKIPLIGGLLGGLIDGFSALLDLVIGVDDYIVKAGRQLNMTAGEARAFNRSLQDAAFNSNNVYINSKKLLESQVDLTSQLGTANILSEEILETNIALKDFAGLEADTRARIAEIAISTEQTGKGTVKGILAQIEGLKKATGIEFQSQQILKEMGAQSGYIALQFSKYPEKMTKTLITVKSMGLELKQLDSMADSFLDFESSISKEFEAQLLTGKEINLTKAREAFLNNDLVTAASEISRQVGTHQDFLNLNRIQADSLAASFGMSRDQLGEMLRQQEILARIGGKQGDTATEQLRLAREKYQTEEKVKAALGEQNYQALTNMSVQEKIASFVEKIKQSIVDFVERTNIIEKIENFINKLSDPSTIQGILGKIRDTISSFIKIAGELLADIIEIGGEIADTLTPLSTTDYSDKADIFAEQVRAGYRKMSQAVDSVGSGISLKDAAAKDKYKSEPGNAKAPDNSMSMAKPGETNVYLKVANNAIEGKALAQKVDESSFESGGGQIHKVK